MNEVPVDIISWKRYDAVVLLQFRCCFASVLVVNGPILNALDVFFGCA
jgi:hypothetical protein